MLCEICCISLKHNRFTTIVVVEWVRNNKMWEPCELNMCRKCKKFMLRDCDMVSKDFSTIYADWIQMDYFQKKTVVSRIRKRMWNVYHEHNIVMLYMARTDKNSLLYENYLPLDMFKIIIDKSCYHQPNFNIEEFLCLACLGKLLYYIK